MSQAIRIDLSVDDAIARVVAASQAGQLVLFIGAGVSRNAGFPLWDVLLAPAISALGGNDAVHGMSLAQIAQAWQHQCGDRAPIRQLLLATFGVDKAPSAVHQLLPTLDPALIVTTNYDRLLQASFPRARVVASPGVAASLSKDEVGILHLHGHLDHLGSEHDGLILTEDDYNQVASLKKAFFECLRSHWHNSLILFLGYGAGDRDVADARQTVMKAYGEVYAKRHLALDLSSASAPRLQTFWQPLGADVLQGEQLAGAHPGEKLHSFLSLCAQALGKTAGAPSAQQAPPAQQTSMTCLEVRSFAHSVDALGRNKLPFLDLLDCFTGRFITKQADWAEQVYPRLRKFLLANASPQQPLRLTLDTHVTLAFAAGQILDINIGRELEIVQRSPTPEIWHRHDRAPDPAWPKWVLKPLPICRSEIDIAVAICLSWEVEKKVHDYIAANLPTVGSLIVARLNLAAGLSSLQCGRHAFDLANALVQHLREQRSGPQQTLHLFISAPNAFAFFLGQFAPHLGRVKLYEFDKSNERDGSYSASLGFPLAQV